MESTETFTPASRADWRKWLSRHHAASKGIWVVYYKKHTGKQPVTYEEAVEEALCFGWIDSRPNTIDHERYKQLFTPRKPKSVWAVSNKKRVARLKRLGLMMPAGLAAVATAKKNGSWNSLKQIDALVIPPDLSLALKANPAATKGFASLSASSRRILLYWITTAKRPETRTKRIAETVHQAADNKRANQYKRK